ncbi:AzlC family ABC transporter permease [Swingsia samuiensis]|nr:AzlC family ABC transporter permease [Swingsia samuiensis]
MIGFLTFGLLFGSQAVRKGLTFLEVPFMTGSNYAGGSEFAAINVWTNPPAILLILGITLLINCRHILMGATLAPWIMKYPKRKVFYWLFLMSDETWAISLSDTQKRRNFSPTYYITVGWLLYLTWVISTFMGAYLGNKIGDLTKFGFDMAFPAVFLVILRSMWKSHRMSIPWIVSLLVSVISYVLIPGGWYVPLGTLAGAVTAWFIVRSL